MQTVFAGEFDINTMIKAGVIKEHFMTHTHVRNAILTSWKQHGIKLCIGMLRGKYL